MYDVLIIGGGLIGMLTARELAAGGARVAVLERGRTGREASWAGGGILSPLYPWRFPDPVTALASWGQPRWRALAEALAEDSGIDPEWTPSGLLILDPEERETALEWAARSGVRLEAVGAGEAARLEPRLAPAQIDAGRGALWLDAVAQVRNSRLVRALRASLDRRGVEVREQTEVTGLVVRDGRVEGVNTRAGTLAGATVLVAGGAWSARLLADIGLGLEVEPVRGQMLLFRAAPGLVRRIVLSRDRYLIPRRDGRVLVGSTLEYVGFDKGTTEDARGDLYKEALRLIPALADCEVEHQWAGLRPGSPTGIPFIGPHPAVRGLFLNTGHFRNGVVLGPASARLAADLCLERAPILDPRPYAPVSD